MKILRCIHTLNPAVGGPIESVVQSTTALRRRGHEVEIICLDAPTASWVTQSPFTVHAVGPGRGSYGFTPGLTKWMKDRHRHFDNVIVHGLWQYSSYGVWRALRRTRTPYFVFPHGMLDPWFKRTYPLKHLKKLLYWPWAEYRVLRDAAAVLFTSKEECKLARESFRLYHCNEAVVSYGTAPPDVDLLSARDEFMDRFPELRGKRLLLFLGRLHEKKGCDLLLDAFAGMSDSPLHLVIAGPCADDKYLQQLKELAGSKATFTGMLSGNLKWGALSAADAFILPSHQENFGIAVAEALACGTPVLISNKVNIWREIEMDGAGYVDHDDRPGATRLIERWSATPPAAREAMRARAQECFARRFHIDRATDSLLSILQRPCVPA